MPRTLAAELQRCGVAVNDSTKMLNKNSPVLQMVELMAAKQHLPAAKLGNQALKKVKKAEERALRSWICSAQALCYSKQKELTKALPQAQQAVDEDPSLAFASNALGMAQLVVARFEKAIAMSLHPEYEKAARADIKTAQETLAEQTAQPAGGGEAA